MALLFLSRKGNKHHDGWSLVRQGRPQTVDIVKVDVQKLAAGYRASKVIGSSVVNDTNETIVKIPDAGEVRRATA